MSDTRWQVLVADDHAIIRDAFRKILADSPDFELAGEASNGHEALARVRERAWDLVVLDMSMPGGRSGLELVKLMRAEQPRLRILVFSMHPEEQYAVRAIRAGASGYLSKESDGDLLLPAMRKVASGGAYVSANVAELLATDTTPGGTELPHTRLSDREYGVFNRIVRGASLTEIAEELSLSIKTVSTHKSHILAKLSLGNQVDLVRYAIDHGLLDTARE
ncbi:response regulator [Ramlibacter albus]|uniref:Response regulator transcription factor n=1 Tax=Ramlibacter albus TaxID=2079448 RepID=A0A923S1N5_9BURK|nr:response regulator transcription factor [Ramlibacter albus]MBC5764480.1 response regulator transcription factor [Ramlibacter albus]